MTQTGLGATDSMAERVGQLLIELVSPQQLPAGYVKGFLDVVNVLAGLPQPYHEYPEDTLRILRVTVPASRDSILIPYMSLRQMGVREVVLPALADLSKISRRPYQLLHQYSDQLRDDTRIPPDLVETAIRQYTELAEFANRNRPLIEEALQERIWSVTQ